LCDLRYFNASTLFWRAKINVFFIEDKNEFGSQKILLTEKNLLVISLVYE